MRRITQAGSTVALMRGGLLGGFLGALLAAGCGNNNNSAVPASGVGGAGTPSGTPSGTGGAGATPTPPTAQSPAAMARPVAPLSGSALSTNLPVFKWQREPGADGAVVDICADRACTTLIEQVQATGDSATASKALPARAIFWRLRGTVSGQPSATPSVTWEAFIPHRAGQPSAAMATRPDFDGDGFADFALDDRAILGGPQGYQRSFAYLAPSTPVDVSFFVAAGDMNGDGFGDVLRLDGSSAQSPQGIFTPSLLIGGPTGFTAGVVNTSVQALGAVNVSGSAGDINGDGYGDFLFKTRFTPTTYLGGANAVTDGKPPAAETSQSFFGFGADYNGDGFADAASTSNGVADVQVTLGLAAGFDPTKFSTITPPAQPDVTSIATVDANGDGFADLAVGIGQAQLALFAGSGTGLAATPFQTLAGQGGPVFPVGTGDFNGDGFPDLVAQETKATPGQGQVAGSGSPQYFVHFGKAGGGFQTTATPVTLPANAALGADSISDVNGDGFDDLTAKVFDTVTLPDGSQRSRATRFALLLGGAGGLTPSQ